MLPIGPLMIEHRLIEKMIAHLKREWDTLAAGGEVSPLFLDAAVDFIRIYADRTHHGKEEDILFAALAKKDISVEDRGVMDDLTSEHVLARKTVAALVEAKTQLLAGLPDGRKLLMDACGTLVNMYPPHIRKEDRVFFPAAMKYFTRAEQDAMLAEMAQFDQGMIHEKYRKVVGEWAERS